MSEHAALLQIDIVDSTKLGEALGDAAMSALWTEHDRLARDLLREWRGREIDKSDGFLLLFAEANDAVGYALAYHRVLAGLRPRVSARAGVHVGPVITRANPAADVARGAKPIEVEGVVKPITSRVMSLASGGQTLLTSQAAKAALATTSLRLQSHGYWRIHGVEEPIELFEVGDDGTHFIPPADTPKVYRVVRHDDLWLPARTVRHTLPAERDPFVGRRRQLQDLARRFDSGSRLVSLLGVGGTGKTRLAQRYGWVWLGEYPGGAWFCDLSQARSLDGIVHAVAQGLDIPLGNADPVVQLGHALAGRGRCLVILDNFEQVSRFAKDTVGVWLERAADARFVVTTREVLGIAGEETVDVSPLNPEEAAKLFLQRAASARHQFEPTADERAAIDQLVTLLDGLPLAIELAAARVRVMSPLALLRRVDERFRLLRSPGGQRPPRQTTLRAAFDWSWDLLSDSEKAALAQLSVFEGGMTIAAVESVLDLSDFEDPPWPVDALQSLVEKSLVRRTEHDRFSMLSTVHEYASERLTQGSTAKVPVLKAGAEARHGAFFSRLSAAQAVADGCSELDNLVAACRRAVARGDVPVAVGALENAWAALHLRGPFRVGIELTERAAAMPQLGTAERARVERVAGEAFAASGKTAESEASFDRALDGALSTGDRRLAGHVMGHLGDLKLNAGHVEESRQRLTTALDIAVQTNDKLLECKAEWGLGNLHEHLGDMKSARRHFESGLTASRVAGDRRWEGGSLGNLGLLCHVEGNSREAERHYSAALSIACELADRQWEGNTRCNLGLLHHANGRLQEAEAEMMASLALARELGHARLEGIVLCNLGLTYEALQLPADAVEHHQAALRVIRVLGDKRYEGQVLNHLGSLYAHQRRFEEARACFDEGEALLTAVADRLNLALLLCSSCELECLDGNTAAAADSLRRANTLAVDTGAPDDSELGRSLSRSRALLAGVGAPAMEP